MSRPEWLGTQAFYGSDGKLRDTARAFLQEVFRENVEVRPNGCWWFIDSRANVDFYRRFWWNGKTVAVHRFAYELWKGPIPAGMYVLHNCDERPCSNPDHLRLGTAKDNTGDMFIRDRWKSRGQNTIHCPQGHPYDADNTTVYHGRRYCRECHRVYSREWARRNKEHKARKLREWRERKRHLT